jgi:endonuclease YncB( thermonuclease family)
MIALALTFVVAAGNGFTCTPTRVWDGDGPIWCAEGPRIRLAGIAAREIDGRCRRWQPCPPGSGIAARDRLVALLGGPRGRTREGHVIVAGPRLSCLSLGQGKGSRTAAWCAAPTIGDLSCAMVRSGMALRWRNYGGDEVCRR